MVRVRVRVGNKASNKVKVRARVRVRFRVRIKKKPKNCRGPLVNYRRFFFLDEEISFSARLNTEKN